MEFIVTKKLNLSPHGKKIKFKFTKKMGRILPNVIYVYIGSISMYEEYDITKEQKKVIMKMLKENNTDVLMDGREFFTYTKFGSDEKIRRIFHTSFLY